MNNNRSRGAIYLATGEKYLREAIHSCKTLKKHNNIHVTLFTDKSGSEYIQRHVSRNLFDNIIIPQFKHRGLKTKVEILMQTPYEQTLFIDSDTEIRENVMIPFQYLEEYDFALAGMRRYDFSTKVPTLIGYEAPMPGRTDIKIFNTGINYFRKNDKVAHFLNLWLSNISDTPNPPGQHKIDCDQQILNDMLMDFQDVKNEVSFKLIPNTVYNCRSLFFRQLKKENKYKDIAIVHEHGLDKNPFYKTAKRARKFGSLIYRKYLKK